MNSMRAMYAIIMACLGITQMCNVSAVQPLPENSVIMFDLHGVLFKVNKGWAGLKCVTHLRTMLKNMKRLNKKYPSCKDALKDGAAFAVNSSSVPHEAVWHLVRLLKKRGYAVYLFSNILPESFADIRRRFPTCDFTLFDGWMTPQLAQGLREKSSDEFFDDVEQRLRADGHAGKTVYLFDDSSAPVAKAIARASTKNTNFVWRGAVVVSEGDVLVRAQKFGLPLS